MKPKDGQNLNEKQIADNMRARSWYWEQQFKDASIKMIPSDKLREINDGINAAQVMIITAREKIHALQYHAHELTHNHVTRIRAGLDDIARELESYKRAVTPVTDVERFNVEDYPVPDDCLTHKTGKK